MNIKKFNEFISEKKKACWKGYKQVGMKNKDGKEVPNCVPDPDDKIEDQKQNENKEFVLKMTKDGDHVTINCKDKDHCDRVLKRYKKRGYKQVDYVEEDKPDTLPF